MLPSSPCHGSRRCSRTMSEALILPAPWTASTRTATRPMCRAVGRGRSGRRRHWRRRQHPRDVRCSVRRICPGWSSSPALPDSPPPRRSASLREPTSRGPRRRGTHPGGDPSRPHTPIGRLVRRGDCGEPGRRHPGGGRADGRGGGLSRPTCPVAACAATPGMWWCSDGESPAGRSPLSSGSRTPRRTGGCTRSP